MGSVSAARRALRLLDEAGREHPVTVASDGRVIVGADEMTVREAPDGALHVVRPDRSVQVWAAETAGALWVFVDGHTFTFRAANAAGTRRRSAVHEGTLTAPMPATVRQVNVAAGDRVRRADVLVVLEAMKMELPVKAAADGRVTAVNCRPGELVQAGQQLIEVEPA
jgi:acetyl/propionyl-CoA carboxylase alpha subunit